MNVAGILQGSALKNDLTPLGREQATKVANKLANERIDLAFSSPIDRAKQTAGIILKHHPETKVKFTDQLIEWDAGRYAGHPAGELHKAWQESGLPFGEFQPEGGESWYQAGERVVNFIEGIISRCKDNDSTILIVGHGVIFTYLFMWADKFNPRNSNKEKYDYYHPAHTAVGIIEIGPTGQLISLSLNDTSHLE